MVLRYEGENEEVNEEKGEVEAEKIFEEAVEEEAVEEEIEEEEKEEEPGAPEPRKSKRVALKPDKKGKTKLICLKNPKKESSKD